MLDEHAYTCSKINLNVDQTEVDLHVQIIKLICILTLIYP